MKLWKLAALAISVVTALTGCGGSGDAGKKDFPEVGITTQDKAYLESVGQYAASYYGIPRESFYLYWDDISPITYPSAYPGIPAGYSIYGLSWNNFAVVHSGLVVDPWQVAVTASHEVCHVAQRAQGYNLTWYDDAGSYVNYQDRWYEAECKYMGEYLAIGYYIQNNKTPVVNEPDLYWFNQMLKFPRPALPTSETQNDAMALDIIVGKEI